ncbi:YitT family protein [Clostridium bornimense]|uniref:YitT family protein n=1 Tax=Clostridium bornimense TaxID=1216932 RepID=UPI001C108F6B|nr:YitT family protein [Clostridium bornimense]MBU5317628.1 YitT family protein [Clostridium bornimense]
MIKKNLKEYSLITIGIILVAISIEYFFAPNNLAAGGVTGLAIVLNYLFPYIGVGILTLIINLLLFAVAFLVLGGSFGKKSIFATIELSLVMWAIEKFLNPFAITSDLVIATIFGTIITAFGMAVVFNNNSSTGGTDILAKVMNKFLHINIGISLLIIDIIITFFAAIVFGLDIGFYSMLSVIILGVTIDRFIDGFNTSKEIMVMTKKENEVKDFIINELSRGCTYLKGTGCYSGKDINVIYAILGRNEFIKLKRYIKEIDSRAFISVRESHEVLGEGFKEIE